MDAVGDWALVVGMVRAYAFAGLRVCLLATGLGPVPWPGRGRLKLCRLGTCPRVCDFVGHITANSELARTRGFRLSN